MTPDWNLRADGDLRWFELSLTDRLLLAFTARTGGASRKPFASLNVSLDVGDQTERVAENRLRTRRVLHLPALVTLRQVHGDSVIPVCYDKTPADLLEGDALYTAERGLGLGIMVADCLPVYVWAGELGCIGLAHCGWRGTARRTAEKLCRAMARRYAVPLSALRFALGPCICPDCLTVGEEVWREFAAGFPAPERFLVGTENVRSRPARRLDIRAANRRLLLDMGLTEAGSLAACTREESEHFFSARRDGTTGRNLAVIAVR